ncbi:uncharacterized protein EDB91DRAFT_390571 [Suillus paluster]|uniref:uncharacterized protein n=1 Tax=Suillus paluster TaxID=48578 RepID=UPI001B85BF25|nr:uncharacterized protein EDB91DRAFT_390571 [Suillus paluster]KAG1739089.1 hypothetical protein EDB91DRAFT_390571 [Suillus paluster]
MTVVSNDPSWWPYIQSYDVSSYFAVAAFAGVVYDWVLTFGQEVELIWRQRWSMMTVLYLSVRYLGIVYIVIQIPIGLPTIPVTDAVSYAIYGALNWLSAIVNALLGVIMITRLHAMSQKSGKVLTLLVFVFVAANTFDGVTAVLFVRKTSGEALILSGNYVCNISYEGNALLLDSLTWILATVWEVLALCLSVWIAVKHFRELRRHSAGGIIGDCFKVLVKSHVAYFAVFLANSCFELGYLLTPIEANQYSLETQIYLGILQFFTLFQMFVLGPRLILSVREYHAELVAGSDTGSVITSIAFRGRVHVSTSRSV